MIVTEITFTPYTYDMLRTIGDVNLPEGVNVGMELAVFVHTDEGVTGCSVGADSAALTVVAIDYANRGIDPAHSDLSELLKAALAGGRP